MTTGDRLERALRALAAETAAPPLPAAAWVRLAARRRLSNGAAAKAEAGVRAALVLTGLTVLAGLAARPPGPILAAAVAAVASLVLGAAATRRAVRWPDDLSRLAGWPERGLRGRGGRRRRP